MGDETKARNSQENEANKVGSLEASCPAKATQNIKELNNKDSDTVMEQGGIRSRGVDSPIRDSDNTKDLSRYNSADNVRQALRELKSPTRASNFNEDASTSKQQPKNSKDKAAESKSLEKERLENGKNPLKRLGHPKPGRKKMSREDFYRGKLSNVVFRSYYHSSASDTDD